MTYAAIKTLHDGTIFRSRLEAKWAVFFDLMGWKYEYEPYDLSGWIPDFILLGHDEILVEVKPFSNFREFDTDKLFNAVRDTGKEKKEILLLGSSIFEADFSASGAGHCEHGASIGWLLQHFDGLAPWFSRAVVNKWKGVYGFFHEEGGWEDRITGIYDGDHCLNIPSYSEIKSIWNQAGSSVQWKG